MGDIFCGECAERAPVQGRHDQAIMHRDRAGGCHLRAIKTFICLCDSSTCSAYLISPLLHRSTHILWCCLRCGSRRSGKENDNKKCKRMAARWRVPVPGSRVPQNARYRARCVMLGRLWKAGLQTIGNQKARRRHYYHIEKKKRRKEMNVPAVLVILKTNRFNVMAAQN